MPFKGPGLAVGVLSTWSLAMDLDLSAQSSQDLLQTGGSGGSGGDGDHTIDGRTVTLHNSTALDTCELDGSTGLVCDHGSTQTAHNADDGSEPFLTFPLDEIRSDLDDDNWIFLVKVYATDNADAADEQWYATLSRQFSAPQAFGLGGVLLGHNGTQRVARPVAHTNSGSFMAAQAASGHNVVAVQGIPICGGWVYSGTWSSGFPALSDMTFYRRQACNLTAETAAHGSPNKPSALHIGLQSGNTSGNFSVTFRRIAVWVAPIPLSGAP